MQWISMPQWTWRNMKMVQWRKPEGQLLNSPRRNLLELWHLKCSHKYSGGDGRSAGVPGVAQQQQQYWNTRLCVHVYLSLKTFQTTLASSVTVFSRETSWLLANMQTPLSDPITGKGNYSKITKTIINFIVHDLYKFDSLTEQYNFKIGEYWRHLSAIAHSEVQKGTGP